MKSNVKKAIMMAGFAGFLFLKDKNVFAQQINFARTYLEFGIHHANNFVELADSGFIIVGSSRVTNSSTQYSFAMRINKYGDTLWTKNYLPNQLTIYGISTVDSSSFIVSNGFYSGGSNVTVAKINLNGDTLWTKEYGNLTNTSSAGWIHRTPDGGYIMNNSEAYDYGLLKLDAAANVQWHTWQNMYIGCFEIKPDNDNGYIAVGGRYGNSPYEVARLDSAGGIIWQFDYGNTPSLSGSEKYARDVVVMDDSNYLVGTNGPDFQLMKIDRNTGDTLWTRNYDTTFYNYEYWVYCMDYAGNNNYIIGTNTYMMLIDQNGDSIWRKENPFPYGFTANDVHKTSDGGFAVCGTMTDLNAGGFVAIAFVKLDSLGNTVFTSVFNPENNFQPLTIYPNPATDKLYLNAGTMVNEKKLVFSLTDLQGRSVLNEQYNSPLPGRGAGGEAIDVSTLPGGIYIGTLKGKEKEVRGKVVIQR